LHRFRYLRSWLALSTDFEMQVRGQAFTEPGGEQG
jgi:hypothetical protein